MAIIKDEKVKKGLIDLFNRKYLLLEQEHSYRMAYERLSFISFTTQYNKETYDDKNKMFDAMMKITEEIEEIDDQVFNLLEAVVFIDRTN